MEEPNTFLVKSTPSNVDKIASTSTPAVTLEGMDTYGTLETILTTFDSRLWLGGKLQLAGVDGATLSVAILCDNQLCIFNFRFLLLIVTWSEWKHHDVGILLNCT